ncbi:ADP-ribosylation factor family-domain-containing protein [Mycena latifolia]|nr:ADP-ribosylation factor family-domain-containing protein [Mycena latifolia]
MGATLSRAANVAAGASADYLFPSWPKTFDIVLLGLDNAGKTSLVNRITRSELPIGTLPDIRSTIGFECESIPYKSNHITLWEIGGRDKIRPLWRSFLWKGHAYMFIVDATASERFQEAKAELHRLHEEIRQREYAHPLLVVANKMDGAGAVDLAELSQALDIAGLAKWGRIMDLKGVSAMSNEGVEEVMDWFVTNVSNAQIVSHNEEKDMINA